MTGSGTTSAGPELPPAPVLVVGAGLIGTSVGLALARRGVAVRLEDVNPVHAALAGSRLPTPAQPSGEPALVVVATPPDSLAGAVAAALRSHPGASVTDVGSVKLAPLLQLQALGRDEEVDLGRYVGSHPMAGSEQSGPLAAAADLFDGRTWAVTPHPGSRGDARLAVERLAEACGAVVVLLDAAEHDLAVARTSHLPHLMAAVTARRLSDAPPGHLALSGQGLRDVTRIAAGDPALWRQIVSANAGALGRLLREARADLDVLVAALETRDAAAVESVLRSGAAAAAAIPGKHGGPPAELVAVTVTVPDRPGALAQLFADVGQLDVNVEDVRIDHDPARPYGVVEIDVASGAGERVAAGLEQRGWAAHR